MEDRKEVVLPRACFEGNRPRKMKPLPGAGRGDVKEKEKQKRNRKRENRGMRNKEGKRAPWGWGTQMPREKGRFIKRRIGAIG